MVLPLFGAGGALIPAIAQISQLGELVENIQAGFQLATQAANTFYSATIASNIQLNSLIRQSSVVLAAQTRFFDNTGQEIDDITQKYDLLGKEIKRIQREIELETRNIVGATDAITNSILNQVITNFGELKGQTKDFASEMQAITPLVTNLTSAFTTFQIPEFQIPQEIRSLLMGDINNPDSMLANRLRGLGLTREAVDEARAAGTFIDLLMEKTQAFADMNVTGAKSITNSFSIIKDVIEQFSREVGADPTFGLERGFAQIASILNDSKFAEALSGIAAELGGPVGQAIEMSMTKMVNAFKSISEIFSEEDIQKTAQSLGRLLGDITSLTLDAGTAIGLVLTRVSKSVSDILIGFDRLTKVFEIFSEKKEIIFTTNTKETAEEITNWFDNLRPPKVYVDLDTRNPEYYQEIFDNQQKIFNQKGPIRLFIEFAMSNSVMGLLSGRNRNLRKIRETQLKSLEILSDELDRWTEKYANLEIDGAKLGAVDTSALVNFAPDLAKDLNSEITRLKGLIDYNTLTEDGQKEINKALSEISSSSELKGAAQQIAFTISQNLSSIDIEQFRNQLNIVRTSLKAVQDERQAALDAAIAGNYVDQIKPYLDELGQLEIKYQSFVDRVFIAQDPMVSAQKAVIAELEATGKSTENATNKLKELEKQAIETGNATAISMEPPSQGQTLVSAFNKAEAAAAAFANTLGKDPQKLLKDFETLTKSVTEGLELGAVDAASAINMLTALATSDLLTTEKRLAAHKQITSIIQQEAGLKEVILSVDRALVDLAEARGDITSEAAAISQNELQIKSKQVQLEEKQALILASQTVSQAGFNKEIDKMRASTESNYELSLKSLNAMKEEGSLTSEQYTGAKETLDLERSKELSKLEQLKVLKEEGSLGQQQLEAEYETLKVELDILEIKKNELVVSEKLAEIEERRTERQLKFNKAISQYNEAVAKAAESNQIDNFARTRINSQTQLNELVERENQLIFELTQKKKTLRDADNISYNLRTQLISGIISLETELNNNQADQADQRMRVAQEEYNELKNRADLVAKLATDEINSREEVRKATERLNTAVRENLQLQTDISDQVKSLANDLNGIRVSEISFEIGNLEEAQKLADEIANFSGSPEELAWLQEREAILLDSANAREATDQAIIRRIEERAELEKSQIDFRTQQTINQAQLEQNMSNLKLTALGAELNAEKAILSVKQQQLAAERDAIIAMGETKGFLTDEQKTRLDIIDNQTAANTAVEESITEAVNGLDLQKQLTQDIVDGTTQKAIKEADFRKKVIDTNSALDVQDRTRPDVVPTQPEQKEPEFADPDKFRGDVRRIIRRKNSTVINGQEYTKADGDKLLKAVEKSNKNQVIFHGVMQEWSWNTARLLGNMRNVGETMQSNGFTMRQMEMVNRLEGRQIFDTAEFLKPYLPQGTPQKSTQASMSNRPSANFTVTYSDPVESAFDAIQGRAQEFIDQFEKDNKEAFDRLTALGLNSRRTLEEQAEFEQLSIANRSNLVNSIMGSGLNAADRTNILSNQLNSARSALLAENMSPDRDINQVNLLVNEINKLSGIINDLNKFAAPINMLGDQVSSLKELVDQRQTEQSRSNIFSVAEEVISTFNQQNNNQELVDLTKRLEELQRAAQPDIKEIIKTAEQIKIATGNTADILANKTLSIAALGSERQTSEVRARIDNLADELIDFYGSETSNQTIIELGRQLEALQNAADPDTQKIVALAEQIKEATAETAENTAEDFDYVSILDSIQQGAFASGGYREADGTRTIQGQQLVYSGYNFQSVPPVQPVPGAPSMDGLMIGSRASSYIPPINANDPVNQPVSTQPANTVSIVENEQQPLRISGGGTGGSSSNSSGGGSVGSTTTIVNNYYPDTSGTVNSQLRLAGT